MGSSSLYHGNEQERITFIGHKIEKDRADSAGNWNIRHLYRRCVQNNASFQNSYEIDKKLE